MEEYRTKTGRVLTDADVQALADEAEHGYDVTTHLRGSDMTDSTEHERRRLIETGQPAKDLKAEQEEEGQTWTTQELTRDFEVIGFAAPFVVVRRRSDGVTGSLEFTHSPRVYFGFKEDKPSR